MMGLVETFLSQFNVEAAAVVVGALVLDLFPGDPPNAVHPVAWAGRFLDRAESWAPRSGRRARFLFGAVVVLVGAALWAGCAYGVAWAAGYAPAALAILLKSVALKLALSARGLDRAAAEVQRALVAEDLDGARQAVSRSLVSRGTSRLDAPRLAAAVIQSVAENSSDSVVAPLFWYSVGGLPAVWAYRFLNTADAMWGYRDGRREWLGKTAARLDDLVNLVPARLTAALWIVAATVAGRGPRAIHFWFHDCSLTASPNAGHPMSAAAGALGVELEKVGHYRLGAGMRPPRASDIGRARRLFYGVVALAFLLATMTVGFGAGR